MSIYIKNNEFILIFLIPLQQLLASFLSLFITPFLHNKKPETLPTIFTHLLNRK